MSTGFVRYFVVFRLTEKRGTGRVKKEDFLSERIRHMTRKKKEKKKKKGSPVLTIIFLIALAVFLFAGYQLFSIWKEYHAGTTTYDDVADEAGLTDLPDSEDVTLEDLGSVDFTSLYSTNSDVVAWIRFPNPDVINYPVVHSKDNSDYLRTTFTKGKNSSGTLFTDMNNAADFSDPNVIIYGHAMKNKSMFGSLKDYKDEQFYKDNPYFYIYTLAGGIYRYKICAVYETTDTSDAYQISFSDAASYQTYLDKIKGYSLYDTGVTLSTDAHLVTLSTCTNRTETGRLLVQGVLVDTYQTENPAWASYSWTEPVLEETSLQPVQN